MEEGIARTMAVSDTGRHRARALALAQAEVLRAERQGGKKVPTPVQHAAVGIRPLKQKCRLAVVGT